MKVSIDHSGCMDPCNQDGVLLNIPICLHNTDVSNAGTIGKDCSLSVGTSTSATQHFGHLKAPAKVQCCSSLWVPKQGTGRRRNEALLKKFGFLPPHA